MQNLNFFWHFKPYFKPYFKPSLGRLSAVACLTAAVSILPGCASQQEVQVRLETTQQFAPTAYVSVLQKLPTKPYTRIGVLDAQAPAGTPLAQVLAELQNKAGALGANAIVVQDLSTKVGGTLQYNPSGGQFTTSPSEIVPHLRAEAIRLEAPGKEEN